MRNPWLLVLGATLCRWIFGQILVSAAGFSGSFGTFSFQDVVLPTSCVSCRSRMQYSRLSLLMEVEIFVLCSRSFEAE